MSTQKKNSCRRRTLMNKKREDFPWGNYSGEYALMEALIVHCMRTSGGVNSNQKISWCQISQLSVAFWFTLLSEQQWPWKCAVTDVPDKMCRWLTFEHRQRRQMLFHWKGWESPLPGRVYTLLFAATLILPSSFVVLCKLGNRDLVAYWKCESTAKMYKW